VDADGVGREGALAMHAARKNLELDVALARWTVLTPDFRAKVTAENLGRLWVAKRCGRRTGAFAPFPELEPGFEAAAIFEVGAILEAFMARTPARLGTFAGGGED